MKKSALQTARASYQPKLPEAIKNGVTIVEGKATQSVADQEAIAKLFPNTYGMPVLRFEAAAKKEYPAINVGVILSGGQAPGGHNVISGLFDGLKALNKESRLFGFLLGPGGLIEHKYMELTADIYIDKTSIEVFIDGGIYSYSMGRKAANNNQDGIRFWGNNIAVKNLEIFSVKSIWN